MSMSAEEFERGYAERSGLTVAEYRKRYRVVPCDCDYEECQGWGSFTLTIEICGECGEYQWDHPMASCPGFTMDARWPRDRIGGTA